MRPRLPVHQRGKSLTVSEICAAPDEKTRQMFADHGISGKREAEFLESNPTCLLRQVADRGLCEKAVENDPLKRGSVESQCAIVVGNSDQAEISGSTPDITDQDNITRTDQRPPLPTGLRDPGVERRLRFLKQSDFAETGGFRGFGGQISRNCIE